MDENIDKLPKKRIAYLDNMRSLIIFLVVVLHSAVTYSGIGGWYYKEGSLENLLVFEIIFFGFLQSHIQAWTLGTLFFISAYLASKALVKYGTAKFIKERLFRLGIPLLIYVFIISPFLGYILHEHNPEIGILDNYFQYIINFWWLGSTGPLWFVQVLLIFSVIYAVIRKCFSNSKKIKSIGTMNIVLIITIIGLIAFLIRLVFPIGSIFLNLQFSYFSSYIVMFICGIIAGENNLIEIISDRKNIGWLKISFIIGIPLWAITMLLGGALEEKFYFEGGFNWQSFSYAIWESLTAIGFSMGLIAFFRLKLNFNNRFTGLIKNNAFGIYFFHAPAMVVISLLLKNWILSPVLKFALVAVITFIFCLMFSYLIRKIKPVGVLLK